MTMKFYLSALFIALVAFGGTSFIMRGRHATATAAKPSLQSPNRPPPPAKKMGDGKKAILARILSVSERTVDAASKPIRFDQTEAVILDSWNFP
jgi:hypothetical protein